jgi:hypothetical protein
VALVDQGQDSLAAGMVRDVARHLIPTNACYDAENALLDDDGSAYKRAGGVYKTAAVTGNRVRQLWDGQLAGGLRTFFATDSAFYTLDSDDTTVRSLGGAGGSVQGARWVAFRDVLYGPGGVMWGGSRKTADYSTGTVTVTNGSTAVVGAGTSWLANVDVGMLLRVGGRARTTSWRRRVRHDADAQGGISGRHGGRRGVCAVAAGRRGRAELQLPGAVLRRRRRRDRVRRGGRQPA